MKSIDYFEAARRHSSPKNKEHFFSNPDQIEEEEESDGEETKMDMNELRPHDFKIQVQRKSLDPEAYRAKFVKGSLINTVQYGKKGEQK